MKTFKRVAWLVVLTAVVGGAGALGYLVVTVRRDVAAQEQALATAWGAKRQAFLDDAALAGAMAWLQPRPGDRDAGAFLNPRLPWEGDSPAAVRFRASLPAGTPSLVLDKSTTEKLGKDWLDSDRAVLDGVDLSWMDTLAGFDRWDLERGSPLAEVDTVDVLTAPMPGLLPLLYWAKLRLLHGMRAGDPAGAGAAVRELARLCFTTESLLGAMVGVAVLKSEDEARRRVVEQGGVAWPTLDDEARLRLRRVLKAVPVLVSPWLPDAEAARFATLPVGRCMALHELGPLYLAMRPLLHEARAGLFARFDGQLRVATECRLTGLRRDWAKPVVEAEPLRLLCREGATDDPTCAWLPRLLWIPGSRALLGDLLLSISAPDPLRDYGAQP